MVLFLFLVFTICISVLFGVSVGSNPDELDAFAQGDFG